MKKRKFTAKITNKIKGSNDEITAAYDSNNLELLFKVVNDYYSFYEESEKIQINKIVININ